MLDYPRIDNCFRALAEPVRRAIVERLASGPANVSALAEPFDLTLAAVVQHVQVLEQCGLVVSEKIGRSRVCRVDPRGLDLVTTWIDQRRSMVERQLDRLGALLAEDDAHPPKISNSKKRKKT